MSSTLSEQVAELEAERDELKERDKDPRIEAWNEIADHPFFEGAYDTEDTLLGAMLARLDAAMEPAQPTVPCVITADEPEPVKVGDTIDAEQVGDLPKGAVLLNVGGVAWERGISMWSRTGDPAKYNASEVCIHGPVTVLYLPEEDA